MWLGGAAEKARMATRFRFSAVLLAERGERDHSPSLLNRKERKKGRKKEEKRKKKVPSPRSSQPMEKDEKR